MAEDMVATQASANLAGDPLKDRMAVNWFQKRWDALKRLRSPLESEWSDCSRAYDLLKVRQFYTGRSDLVLPTIANLVERLVPRVVRSTVGRDEFFVCHPNTSEDAGKAETNQALVAWQLEMDGFRKKYSMLVRDACIYGTGIWKARWKYEVRQGDGAKLFDGPSGDPLAIDNVWVDPRAADFDRTDVIERMSLSYTEVRKFERLGVFQNVEEALKAGGSGSKNDSLTYLSNVRNGQYREQYQEPGYHEYCEFWGEFPIDATDALSVDQTETVPCIIGILNGKHVVRLERNPFACQRNPYFKATLLERTGEFYGVSLVRKVLALWIEQNDLRNQANDSRSFSVCPVAVRRTGQQTKEQSLTIFPGRLLQGDFVFGAFPDVTGPAMAAEPIIKRDMEETTGAPSLFDAQADSESATEASIMQVESSVRVASYAYSVEDTFIKPYLSFCHELNRQYLKTEVAVRIKGFKGFDFRPVTPQDVAGNFTFVTLGASSMARGAALTAQFLQTTDRMLVVEQTAPGTFDMNKWWSLYFREVLDVAHPDIYIKGMKFDGRVPTVEEVHLMLLQGRAVEPDPRQNFAETLPQYGAYLAKVQNTLPEDILKLFIAHLTDAEATARMVLQAKMAQMMATRTEMMSSSPSGSGGGKQNKPRDDSDRDGKGLGTARQMMKAGPGVRK